MCTCLTMMQMWSLHPPFDLLASFSFPPSVVPSTIAVDPSERFFYVASTTGDVYHIPLFKRRAEVGSARTDLEAVGGGGQGAAPIKAEGQVISLKSVHVPLQTQPPPRRYMQSDVRPGLPLQA